MKAVLKALVVLVLLLAVAAGGLLWYVMRTGVSAREQPGAIETAIASRVRNLAIPGHARDLANPVTRSDEVLASGRAHFADHCAVCHANNGSGDTTFGRGLYPPPPDLRLARTQDLRDGELFYIIEHGIRFTGMPGFGSGDPSADSESWPLVHFIRHLPSITDAELIEMEALNPAPPDEIRQRLLEEQFLQGGDVDPPPAPTPHKH